jgi:DNA-binding protein HU-beta
MYVNKSELIEQVASRADIKRTEAESALNALTEVVKETLQRGGDVAITGFGKFSVAERGARQGVNPQTGERIQIAASKAPKFSAGADFKKALKGS